MLSVIFFTGNMDVLISDLKSTLGLSKEDTTQQLVFGNSAGEESTAADSGTIDQVSRKLDEQVERENALAYDENTVKNREIASSSNPNNQEVEQPAAISSDQTYAKLYHIIAGSFTVLRNAEKQRASLLAKGLEAEILPRKGNFYMVSLGSYDNMEQAAAAMKQKQEKLLIELWVMRNK